MAYPVFLRQESERSLRYVSVREPMVVVERLQERPDRAHYEDTEERSPARHARSVDPAHALVGRPARLGHRAAAPADFAGCAPGQSGLALPGAPSAGATGGDRVVVGRLRTQPAREVLPAHQDRPQTARRRNGQLGADGGRRPACVAAGLTRKCSKRQACPSRLPQYDEAWLILNNPRRNCPPAPGKRRAPSSGSTANASRLA